MPLISPHGQLAPDADAPLLAADLLAGLEQSFACGAGHLLWQSGAGEPASALPSPWSYWRDAGALG